jgi:hypothetical protein
MADQHIAVPNDLVEAVRLTFDGRQDIDARNVLAQLDYALKQTA